MVIILNVSNVSITASHEHLFPGSAISNCPDVIEQNQLLQSDGKSELLQTPESDFTW